jgi:Zn-dependent protease with chaperone function
MFKNMILVLSSIFIFGCAYSSSTNSSLSGTDRKQFMLIKASDLRKGADEAYADVLSKAKKAGTLNTDKRMLKKLRTIANNLIQHMGVFRADAKNWRWEVNLIKSDELNAWCMPGGKIAFYTGLIEKLKLNDAQIAAIMGHEMGHALREHGRERASQSAISNAAVSLVGAYFNLGSKESSLAQKAMNVSVLLPFSRAHEKEADKIGVELSARAGYDPYEAVIIWEKMSKLSGKQPLELLSTHPSNESRIKDLKAFSKKVNHLYKKAKKG